MERDNATVHPPGLLQRRQAARNRYAGPAKFSDRLFLTTPVSVSGRRSAYFEYWNLGGANCQTAFFATDRAPVANLGGHPSQQYRAKGNVRFPRFPGREMSPTATPEGQSLLRGEAEKAACFRCNALAFVSRGGVCLCETNPRNILKRLRLAFESSFHGDSSHAHAAKPMVSNAIFG